MHTSRNTLKITAIKSYTAIIPPVIVSPSAIFSKAWEWDQMCNHCVD
jgi:hypothetical protein